MISSKDKEDKNIFKKIIKENWESFKKEYPRYENPQYNDVIDKMLKCGTELGGYTEYRCLNCGIGERKIAFSCKCMFCLSCVKVHVDEMVSRVSKMLHPGMRYRHVVLTVPEQLRPVFYKDRFKGQLLDALIKVGHKCLEDLLSDAFRKKVKIGTIIVLQTYGRSGQYNPHIHIIMTNGGIDEEKMKWKELKYVKFDTLHMKWQYYLLEMIRENVKTDEMEKMIDKLYKEYPKGFVANIDKGKVPKSSIGLAKYLAKYVASPPISVRRIIEYTGEKVTYCYNDHVTKKKKTETVDVMTFMGRMVQHILPKGFQRTRYYGLQATKSLKKWRKIIKEIIGKIKGKIKDVYEIIESKSYRERFKEGSGKDPLKCPYCGVRMVLWRIWHPEYGVIYSEEENMKRGKYEEKTNRESGNGDRGGGYTVWSTTKNVQLSLF